MLTYCANIGIPRNTDRKKGEGRCCLRISKYIAKVSFIMALFFYDTFARSTPRASDSFSSPSSCYLSSRYSLYFPFLRNFVIWSCNYCDFLLEASTAFAFASSIIISWRTRQSSKWGSIKSWGFCLITLPISFRMSILNSSKLLSSLRRSSERVLLAHSLI